MSTQSLRERLRESTWAAILDAAEGVAATCGLPETSLQAIAQRAGTAVGTIYNYFDDRNALIEALFDRRREELFCAVDAAAKKDAGRGFERELDTFVRSVFVYFDGRRDFLRIAMESERPRPAVVKGRDGRKLPALQQLHTHAERIVRLGMKEKRLRSDGEELFASVLVSMIRGVLVLRAVDEASLESETEAIVSLFMHGVAR